MGLAQLRDQLRQVFPKVFSQTKKKRQNADGTGAGSYQIDSGSPPQFHVLVPAASGFTIDASSNLIDWLPLYTNAGPAAPINYPDPSSINLPRRFYRATPWP